MSKSNDKTTLGDRLKGYEEDFEKYIDYNNHIIVRIDGHKFSKFTKGFEKPFDNILSKSMIETTKDLCEEFNAVTGYTQSDEITLVIPKNYITKEKKITSIKKLYKNIVCSQNTSFKNSNVFAIDKKTKEKYYVSYYTSFLNNNEDFNIIELDTYNNDNEDNYFAFTDKLIEEDNQQKQLGDIEKIFNDFDLYYNQIDNQQIYNGRIQKLSSLISSFTTMRFNYHLKNLIPEVGFDYPKDFGIFDDDINKRHNKWLDYIKMIKSKVRHAWFDARVYGVESNEEAFNSVMWRVRDCYKNACSMFSQSHCSHKELQNMNGQEQIEYVLKKTGKDFNNMVDNFKYGTLIKKESYMKDVHYRDLNYKDRIKFNTPDMPQVERSRVIEISKKMTTFSEEEVEFVMTKVIKIK